MDHVNLPNNTPPTHLTSHQLRVVDEKTELDVKLIALGNFIDSSPIFATVDSVEQERLKKQRSIMLDYSNILKERISAF